MKRLGFILGFLLLANIVLADTVTFDSYTTNNDVDYSGLNLRFYKIYNEVDGGLNTDNFKAGGIASKDFATAVNPLVRDNELIGEMVYSGLTIPTAAGLTSTFAAGVAYIENDADGTLHRVVTNATQKTFTTSKDTWCYLSFTGAFSYSVQNNGASQPSTPDNMILLAKVVTNATDITTVTDYTDPTPANMRIYLDYKNGLIVSRDVATATKVTIGRGEVELGQTGKSRRNTDTIVLDLTTAGRNGIDTGSLAEGYYYVHAVPDDGTTDKIDFVASLSSTDATTLTDERLIGWFYASGTAAVSGDSIGAYRGRGGDAPNIVKRTASGDIAVADTAFNNDLDTTATRFFCSGERPIRITGNLEFLDADSAYSITGVINIDTVDMGNTIRTSGPPATGTPTGLALEWVGYLPGGTHTIKLRSKVDGGANNVVKRWTMNVEEL
jgi:hypothetical protein